MALPILAAACAAVNALVLQAPAHLPGPPADMAPAPAVALQPAATPAAAPNPHDSLLGPALDADHLDSARGGTDTTTNNMNVTGTVSGNTATNIISGTNTISEGAFANAAGIPMVVQNTGANVLIQNATIINLRME